MLCAEEVKDRWEHDLTSAESNRVKAPDPELNTLRFKVPLVVVVLVGTGSYDTSLCQSGIGATPHKLGTFKRWGPQVIAQAGLLDYVLVFRVAI